MKAFALLGVVAAIPAAAADPFAGGVIGYNPGSNPISGYTNPTSALGEPTRFTGAGVFPSVVTPFNPAFMPEEIVSIGEGGSLTLSLGREVFNDPLNPFGLDLLVFGDAFFIDPNYPSGVAAGLFGGGGILEVSANLNSWTPVPGAAIANYPTLGYADLPDPYALTPGNVLTDFTRPVDPAFDPIGKNFAQIVTAYDGSGGGTGVDIGLAAVGSIRYVRISNPVGSGVTIEIDAVSAVVPAPGTIVLLGGLLALRRTRR